VNSTYNSIWGTTSRSVTFARSFMLPGMDTPHRPGTFELRETREALDVMHEAYRITRTIVLIDGGRTEALEVTADALEFALALDASSVPG
jgi:deoxyinosine 3'endonuclease (endonuclease V)